ncbi:MAG: hypothetical protein ACK6AO_11945 [Planctomycetota bacterium]|jgi:hypothetical protein
MTDHLPREEYVEQAYLFRILWERLGQDLTLQDLLQQCRYEVLATTKLPLAIDFLYSELKHSGAIAQGMRRLGHYFTPFQAFLVGQAEEDSGRFDFRTSLLVLQAEALYKSSAQFDRQGLFFYQFESLCRHRLSYDGGLKAMSLDPLYDNDWQEWLLIVQKQLGLVDLADLIYGRSEDFVAYRKRHLGAEAQAEYPILFGVREGKIAYANRRKEPLFLFAAMQRHLGYPHVPKRERVDQTLEMIPQMQRRIERLEARMKLMEDEHRQGIDITKFYGKSIPPMADLSDGIDLTENN